MRLRANFHLRLLLAPTLGLAINLVLLFTLSRLGFSIKTVATPILIACGFFIVYFLVAKKITWMRPAVLIYCAIVFATFIPYILPLLKHGFEWLAFVNGDMSYYSTSSTRLLDYGYSELPASGNIHDIKDHSLLTWDFHNNLNYRTGAELFLAYLVGISGLTAHQVYMPLNLAFNFCVVSGAGALALLGVRKWSSALWAMALVALSPMLTIEVTMQQLAQALGLALLTALCVSYIKAMTGKTSWAWVFYTVISFASLAISYFEIIPFFALFVLLVEAAEWQKWMNPKMRKVLMHSGAIMVGGILLLLNSYALSTVQRIIFAAKVSFESSAMTMQTDGISLFPFFFLPSNGALIWGWMPLTGQPSSLVIVSGLLMCCVFIGLLYTSKIRSLPSAQMSIIMLFVAVVMWFGGNGYGLFKIAMFIQPFLIATFVAMVTLLVTKRLLQRLSFMFMGLSFIPSQQVNIMRVSGELGSSPVPYASTAELGHQLREIRDKLALRKNIKVFSDTPSFELFSLEAYYFKGVAFDNLTKSLPLLKSVGALNKFAFGSEYEDIFAEFRLKKRTGNFDEYLLSTTSEFSIVNRESSPTGFKLQMSPMNEFSNHLMLMESSMSAANTGYYRDAEIALYQLEADPVFLGRTMSAVGQYHLYEILGAIRGSRLQLSISALNGKDEDFRLPVIRVLGAKDLTVPLVGRGSARVVSETVDPREIDSLEYIGIDFGRKGTLIDSPRTGALALFGKSIKLDIRKVVVFARDISYISPEKYAAFKRPRLLSSFPMALEDPGLEYSGIFEDGWISDAAYVILQTPLNNEMSSLHISGMIPDIGGSPFSSVISIKVNNRVVFSEKQEKGALDITVPIPSELLNGSSSAKVLIESSAVQRLPNGDGRPVSMHLSEIGFK
jgi:hypothetical protein